MSVKTNPFDFRTVIYILLVVVIVAGGAYLILGSSSDSEEVYSVGEVLANKNFFVNKTIVVEGIYYTSDIENEGYAGTPPSETDPYQGENGLRLDFSNIDNLTQKVQEENKYRFTGKLQWYAGSLVPNTEVILIVEKIKAL